jgi:hypothetical protein
MSGFSWQTQRIGRSAGFLNGCRYLLQDRDTKFCAVFDAILEAVRIKV